jgi:LacI family transcriptional regulator
MQRHATLADVAARAGVSPMTVSRIINGRNGASTATKERVLAAVRELDYRPNTLAKGLKIDRSGIIGLIVPDIVNPFFPEIIRGAELAARPAGYTLLCCNVVEDPAREEEVLETLLNRRVDGVIICSARMSDKRLFDTVKRCRAAVLINRSAPKSIAGTIEVDYRRGMIAAVDHLVRNNRQHIAYAGGYATSRGDQQRRQGILQALDGHGLELVLDIPCSPDIQGGIAGATAFLDSGKQIDAIICYNDLIAIGLLGVLKERSVAVPHDIAIIGCDDILAASLVNPALSTLRVAKEDLGAAAMRMLIDRIDQKHIQQGIIIEPELVLRASTEGA